MDNVQGNFIRAVIESPKGDVTVNDDLNFTTNCFGDTPPAPVGASLVTAWCQIFFPELASIPAQPDQMTAEQVPILGRSWRHPALDGAMVELHAGERHTFVVWFEFEIDPMVPHVFQPFSSIFKPFAPLISRRSGGDPNAPTIPDGMTGRKPAKPKAKKAKPKKAQPKKHKAKQPAKKVNAAATKKPKPAKKGKGKSPKVVKRAKPKVAARKGKKKAPKAKAKAKKRKK